MKIKIVANGKQLLLTMKETKTVEYEDLCFGDVFEIDGNFFMKANGRIYDVVDGNKDSSMEFSIDEKVKEVNGEFVVK